MLQIALSLPLLVGAGLFLESLRNVRGIDAGFTMENVLIAQLNPSLNGYPQERIRNLYGELLTGIRAIPGVLAASLAVEAPISGGWDQLGIVVEGFVPRQGERMSINWNLISTDYFKTLRIPLVAGREFTAYDTLLTPKVAIINEAFARYFFGKTNPIGRRIGTGGAPDMEIVGVVKDAKYVDLREEQRRHFYSPVGQEPRLFDLTLQVRTAGDPAASADLVRSVAGRVDPDLPLYNVKTLESQISESIVRDRLVAWLTSLFGLVAVILAALGLYGVVAFSVARRTREIGVRIAMGARKGDILVLVLRQTGLLVIAGILAGICGAFAVTRLFASLLYETKPSDPAAFVAATLVLTAAAALASYLPARRAARTDPVIALRHE
jgi:predicted permease